VRHGRVRKRAESRSAPSTARRLLLWASAATPLDDGLTCAALGDVGVRAVAVHADGRIDCQVTGAWEAFDGLACF
jgi:hypothetical protein